MIESRCEMLKIENLTVQMEAILLNNVNFKLESGTIYGLSAYNGAGKTTLLRTLAGLRDEIEGTVSFMCVGNTMTVGREKRRIFYFETSDWFDTCLSGRDYLNFISAMWNQEIKKNEIDAAIDFWELTTFVDKAIKKYSLGMKQKLLLSLYEVSNANLWLMDEPTIGLDKKNCDRFIQFLYAAKQKGKAVFFSSHQQDSLYAVCDYLYEIHDKQLILIEHLKKEE